MFANFVKQIRIAGYSYKIVRFLNDWSFFLTILSPDRSRSLPLIISLTKPVVNDTFVKSSLYLIYTCESQ